MGEHAGTQDLDAVALERAVLRRCALGYALKYPWIRVLDLGCGLGDTLAGLPRQTGVGLDRSEAMISGAQARHADRPDLAWRQVDITGPWPADLGQFDVIYTQRSLINVPPDAVASVIQQAARHVRVGGSVVAIENSRQGLDALNRWRGRVGVPAIIAPWHNVYLDEPSMAALAVPGAVLKEAAVDYSSTYYFASRVLAAWWAHQRGRSPAYGSWINRLAVRLPVMGRCGQGRYWRWERQ